MFENHAVKSSSWMLMYVFCLYRIQEIQEKKNEERRDGISCLHSSMSLQVMKIHTWLLHDYYVMLIKMPSFWDTASSKKYCVFTTAQANRGWELLQKLSQRLLDCTWKILCTPKVKYFGSNTTTVKVHNLASSTVITNACASHHCSDNNQKKLIGNESR